jgi:hypothetical protein
MDVSVAPIFRPLGVISHNYYYYYYYYYYYHRYYYYYYLFTAIGFAPGGSSSTIVQTKHDKATLYSSTTQYNKT